MQSSSISRKTLKSTRISIATGNCAKHYEIQPIYFTYSGVVITVT